MHRSLESAAILIANCYLKKSESTQLLRYWRR